MALGQNFSGSSKYYTSGAYERPESEVDVKLIADSGKRQAELVSRTQDVTVGLLKQGEQRLTTAAQEAKALLDWGINNEMTLANTFSQELLATGIQNPTLSNDVIAPAIKASTVAQIGLKRAKTPEERKRYMDMYEKAQNTLNQITPIIEARENRLASFANQKDAGLLNQPNGSFLNTPFAQSALYGTLGTTGQMKGYKETWGVDDDGNVTYSGTGPTPTGFNNQYTTRTINKVNAYDFWSRQLAIKPDWKKASQDMMNEVLYDKQGNLLQKYLVTETKNGVEVPKITQEKRTYYDSDSDAMKSIYTQRFTPDEEKIKNELSTISKTLFGKYSITNENIQSIMQDLGIEGNAVAGPNNNVNLYNQIEQSVADKTIEGLSTKIFDFVNLINTRVISYQH